MTVVAHVVSTQVALWRVTLAFMNVLQFTNSNSSISGAEYVDDMMFIHSEQLKLTSDVMSVGWDKLDYLTWHSWLLFGSPGVVLPLGLAFVGCHVNKCTSLVRYLQYLQQPWYLWFWRRNKNQRPHFRILCGSYHIPSRFSKQKLQTHCVQNFIRPLANNEEKIPHNQLISC